MSEITYEYIRNYLKVVHPEDDEIIENIKREAINENVPIIKSEVKKFLEVILLMNQPTRILEIGTAVGYSSIIMSRHLKSNGTITTIERSKEMVVKAKQNFKKTNRDNITLLEGDAGEVLKELVGPYDFIFMDAAKGQYLTFLPECLRLLKKDGILISDNVLQNGMVAKSRFSIPRRQRTIHRRMREYLWEINHNDSLKTSILPIADGLTISYKIK